MYTERERDISNCEQRSTHANHVSTNTTVTINTTNKTSNKVRAYEYDEYQ